MPPAVFCSLCSRYTTTRSPRGINVAFFLAGLLAGLVAVADIGDAFLLTGLRDKYSWG